MKKVCVKKEVSKRLAYQSDDVGGDGHGVVEEDGVGAAQLARVDQHYVVRHEIPQRHTLRPFDYVRVRIGHVGARSEGKIKSGLVKLGYILLQGRPFDD